MKFPQLYLPPFFLALPFGPGSFSTLKAADVGGDIPSSFIAIPSQAPKAGLDTDLS